MFFRQLRRVIKYTQQHTRDWSFVAAAQARGKGEHSQQKLRGLPTNSPILEWHKQLIAQTPKMRGTGEDSFFIERLSGGNLYAGVCDGVGGWADTGIDPAAFSYALTYHLSRWVRKQPSATPSRVLSLAFDEVVRDSAVEAGSATACVLSLDRSSGLLSAANLGDSCFTICRDNKIVHYQPAQTYYFNAPYQLAKVPKRMQQPGSLMNRPDDADKFSTQLQDGDTIFLMTDGISDNVFAQTLPTFVKHMQEKRDLTDQKNLQLLADSILEFSWRAAHDEEYIGPFSTEAKTNGLNWPGGKVDDMTIIAIKVIDD